MQQNPSSEADSSSASQETRRILWNPVLSHISPILTLCVISRFRREVGENLALLGCYAASGGNILRTFRDKL